MYNINNICALAEKLMPDIAKYMDCRWGSRDIVITQPGGGLSSDNITIIVKGEQAAYIGGVRFAIRQTCTDDESKALIESMTEQDKMDIMEFIS
jgi:hypothetical protein